MTDDKFDQMVNDILKTQDWFEFDGQNCEEPCLGWDGHERRCECGNRRVSWVLTDDGTYVYAEAW